MAVYYDTIKMSNAQELFSRDCQILIPVNSQSKFRNEIRGGFYSGKK